TRKVAAHRDHAIRLAQGIEGQLAAFRMPGQQQYIGPMYLDDDRQTGTASQADGCPSVRIGPGGVHEIRSELGHSPTENLADGSPVQWTVRPLQDFRGEIESRVVDRQSVQLHAPVGWEGRISSPPGPHLVRPRDRGNDPDRMPDPKDPEHVAIERSFVWV